HAPDEWHEEQESADKRRHRIPGHAEYLHGAQATVHHGASGAQGYTPERKVEALRGQGPLHQVVLAHGRAARCNKDIGIPILRAAHRSDDVLDAVAGNAKVAHLRTLTARRRVDRKAVRIDNLARSRLAAGWDKFVPCTQQRDLWLAVHADARMVHGSGEHQVAARQPMPSAQEGLFTGKIDPLRTNISLLRYRLLDSHSVAIASSVLLNDDGIAASRHDTTGKNARGLTASDFSIEWATCSNFTYHLKCDRRSRDIVRTHGIAVHCRNRRGRLRA